MDCLGDDVPNDSQGSLRGSNCSYLQGNVVEHEIQDDFDNSLDHIVLRERRRILLSRIWSQSYQPAIEVNGNSLPGGRIVDVRVPTELHYSESDERNACQQLSPSKSDIVRKSSAVKPPDGISGAEPVESSTSGFPGFHCSAKVENRSGRPDYLPALQSLSCVKTEPLDANDLLAEEEYKKNVSTDYIFPLKSELLSAETPEDILDHLCLVDRVKLLADDSMNVSGTQRCMKGTVPSTLDVGLNVLEYVKPISVFRPRKRKRTATNSAGTALDEDAPGLLKVLIEKGVSVDELKLYDGLGADDLVDDTLPEDSFSELEAVISQVFSHRQSSLKFPPLRCSKSTKASYYLACLMSLVEQTRYLRNRKWPVEWGWCRDLQCFVFVFPRHNRIVLERPEYGYATYFFELVDSLPTDWQIKRLVTAMKLTGCGRITLIEDRPLVVGEDLSEGEARVLEEYGWTPNTGLGTMLNYCDRVVHDRKNVMDGSEWKSKIGILLINGYNGGNIVPKDIPKKLNEYIASQTREIKLEM